MNSATYSLRRAVEAVTNQIHTALPGRIESYDHEKQKADVKPLLKRVYKDGEVLDVPVVPSVPVVFPRGNSSSLTFPLKKGDGVLLVFAERSLDKWLSEGGIVAPDDPRKFDLTDAVAIPGLYPFNVPGLAANNEDVILIHGENFITIKSSGEIEISGANKIVLRANGDIEIGGAGLKKLMTETIISSFNTHLHLSASPGSVTGPPIDATLAPVIWTTMEDATQKVSAQ